MPDGAGAGGAVADAAASIARGGAPPAAREVEIPLGWGLVLTGDLMMPADASGIVVFAHGSGAARTVLDASRGSVLVVPSGKPVGG